ncbi:MAG: hypothetical protein ACRC5R_06285, partial [Mycoplasmatales bacterium]
SIGSITIISDNDISYQSFIANNFGEININNNSMDSDKLIVLQGTNKLGNIEVKCWLWIRNIKKCAN